jgi:hypothetical protein
MNNKPYAVVLTVDGQGVVVAHTRPSQMEGNELAVEIATERKIDPNRPLDAEKLNAFRREVLDTVAVHGVYRGDDYEVTVIEVGTTESSPADTALLR